MVAETEAGLIEELRLRLKGRLPAHLDNDFCLGRFIQGYKSEANLLDKVTRAASQLGVSRTILVELAS